MTDREILDELCDTLADQLGKYRAFAVMTGLLAELAPTHIGKDISPVDLYDGLVNVRKALRSANRRNHDPIHRSAGGHSRG